MGALPPFASAWPESSRLIASSSGRDWANSQRVILSSSNATVPALPENSRRRGNPGAQDVLTSIVPNEPVAVLHRRAEIVLHLDAVRQGSRERKNLLRRSVDVKEQVDHVNRLIHQCPAAVHFPCAAPVRAAVIGGIAEPAHLCAGENHPPETPRTASPRAQAEPAS